MRLNYLLAVLFSSIGLVALADLGISLHSASGTVVAKQDVSSGFGKARRYDYQVSVQTDAGLRSLSLAPATFAEVTIGSPITFSDSAVFARTASIVLNGQHRDNTLTQSGTIVSAVFFACFILVLGCLTLPGVSRRPRRRGA